MTLKIKNSYIQGLLTIMNHAAICCGKSRMRGRFNKPLIARMDENEKHRQEMLVDLADKDENGKAKTEEFEDEEGENKRRYVVTPENLTKFQDQYKEMMNEDFVIDITESNKAEYEQAKDLVLNSTMEFKGGDDALYNVLCEAFEVTE